MLSKQFLRPQTSSLKMTLKPGVRKLAEAFLNALNKGTDYEFLKVSYTPATAQNPD